MPEFDSEITSISVEDELSRSYMNYAMSVIIARALPDIRDGLKPVQRRILYAMRQLNLAPDGAFVKCAKVCGQTSGDFHPHGEQVIYPTLVRMAQHWTLRYPLIQGQGNFGSVDGDSPAAMRYTECRLTPIAMELLEDLDRDTVEWVPNYSQSQDEPTVLPAKFPNLLCNGSQGIAVGMSTDMPPHNLTEVCDAILMRIDDPQSTLDDVMKVMPGPDFPTYGSIRGVRGIRSAYESGRGSVLMAAKWVIEPRDGGGSVIVVTELPYQVNKTNLVKNIADMIKNRKFDGLTEVQDYSDKRGMRIEINIRRDVQPMLALKYLLKHSQLQTSFSCQMLSLIGGVPRVAPLLTILDEYVAHRREVITRRTRYELVRAFEEVHLNEGYQIARANMDGIVKLIRASADTGTAKVQLIRQFGMSPLQANAILAMPLGRLTQLEQTKLERNFKEVLRRTMNLLDILTSEERLKKVMKDEIIAMQAKHGDERRTKIDPREPDELTDDELIPDEESIITISRDGYIKRISIDAWRSQKRGGKGVKSTARENDEFEHLFQVRTHHFILFFTDRGKVYKLKAHEIPESGRYAKGLPVINYIAIDSDDHVSATISIKDINSDGYLAMITKKGLIKRTPLKAFANIRSTGIRAINLPDEDQLHWVLRTDGNDDLILVTRFGQSIRFNEQALKDRSRNAGGVRGIRLKESKPGDEVIGADVVRSDASLLVVGENGLGKRTMLSEYSPQGRGGSGVLTMKITDKTGPIVGAEIVDDEDMLLVQSDKNSIKMKVSDIRPTGRTTQGVRLQRLKEGQRIMKIARIVQEADDGDYDDVEASSEDLEVES
ncbi:MAG: DNA gyrase subunit A [Fimbriimonadaceae bacterium]